MKLATYIIVRLVALVAQVLGAILAVFIMVSFIPYDPSAIVAWAGGNQAAEAFRESKGINDPFYEQFTRYLENLMEGSFGEPWILSGNSINQIILEALPYTLATFGLAVLIYTPLAVLLGITAASNEGSIFDTSIKLGTILTYAVPSYVIGIWLVELGKPYDITPFTSGESFLLEFKYLILPILTTIVAYTGYQFRQVRNFMREVLQQKYIITARAKGLPERVVIFKHAVRNALPQLITTIAVTFPIAFSGVAVLEVIFKIPGIGNKLVQAALQFDWPVIISITTIFVVLNGIVTLITDILVRVTDPMYHKA